MTRYIGVRLVDSTPLPIRVGNDAAAMYREIRTVGHVYKKVESPDGRTCLRLEIASEAAEAEYGPAPRSIDWDHEYLAWLKEQVQLVLQSR